MFYNSYWNVKIITSIKNYIKLYKIVKVVGVLGGGCEVVFMLYVNNTGISSINKNY